MIASTSVSSLFHSDSRIFIWNSCINLYICCDRLAVIQDVVFRRLLMGGAAASLTGVVVSVLGHWDMLSIWDTRLYPIFIAIVFAAYLGISCSVFLTVFGELMRLCNLWTLLSGSALTFWKAMRSVVMATWAFVCMYDGLQALCKFWSDDDDAEERAHDVLCFLIGLVFRSSN